MNIVCIHQNFPGQYRYLATFFAKQGHQVIGLGEAANFQDRPDLPGIKRVGYPTPQPASSDIHPYLEPFEAAIQRGQDVVRSLRKLQADGFTPDLVVAHPGWGEALYVKDLFPKVPLIGLFEFYHNSWGQSVEFDPEFPNEQTLDDKCRIRSSNASHLLSLTAVDIGICPTAYQKSVHPAEFHPKLQVIHDGVYTDFACPNPHAQLTLNLGDQELHLNRDHEVITFVNRNLEPFRGYHMFMRALPKLLQRRPQAQVVIVGGDGVSYGSAPPADQTWKDIYLNEVREQLDLNRVHFTGHLPYPQLIQLFQLSSVHVYLTYPFVLSWSMLEAMSCQCLVLGSRTPPVEEVIRDGENGLLVDFFDVEGIADRIAAALADPESMQPIREQARHTILKHYDLNRVCLPQHIQLINSVLAND